VSAGAAGAGLVAVGLEVGAKRVFASALDWPGWSRGGRTEGAAVAALAAAGDRYRLVAALAGLDLPFPDLEVVERVAGNASTDFGVPGVVLASDGRGLSAEEARRQGALVSAAWARLADVVARAPAVLRKGPRGGGRDRDAIVAHVLGAEESYAGRLDIRPRELPDEGGEPGEALRRAMLAVLEAPSSGEPFKEKGWPSRYAARRIAWHALDHAWEIEDRSEESGA